MTVFCGMAQSVTTLALARIGVGIGESGGTPASQSIIADLFSKNERPRALGIYAIGTYLGVFLGYFIGGYVNQHYGWRMAFYVAGLPGIALAAVLWLTISEPKRGAMAETFTPEPIGPTLGFLASQRTFVILLVGFCLTTYTNYATSAWIPPFLARVHHLSSVEIGTYAGTFKGLCGIAGTLLGGFVVAQIGRRDDRWKLWAPAITSGLAGPVFALCMLTPDFTTMVATLAATSFLVGFQLGPIFAIAQTVAKPSMRALASRIHAADGGRFRTRHRPAGRRHAQRRAEERLWRRGRALFAAVGSGDVHARCPAVRLGGAVDTRRYPAGELIRRLAASPPLCFYYCFDPGLRPAARIAVGSNDLYVIYITDAWRKTGQKHGRMKPFCRNRETILKHTRRTLYANRGRQRRPGGIT